LREGCSGLLKKTAGINNRISFAPTKTEKEKEEKSKTALGGGGKESKISTAAGIQETHMYGSFPRKRKNWVRKGGE